MSGWRAMLRQHNAAISFVVLLTLGLFEPLACILHCELWPNHTGAHTATAGMAAHLCALGYPSEAAPAATTVHGDLTRVTQHFCPSTTASQRSSMPFATQPLPFHEMLVAASALLIVIFVMQHAYAWLSRTWPWPAYPPLLRPPIALLLSNVT